MTRFFHVSQFAGPAIALPASYWCWWQAYDGSHLMAVATLTVPIVYAYVVPGLGPTTQSLCPLCLLTVRPDSPYGRGVRRSTTCA